MNCREVLSKRLFEMLFADPYSGERHKADIRRLHDALNGNDRLLNAKAKTVNKTLIEFSQSVKESDLGNLSDEQMVVLFEYATMNHYRQR